MDTEILGSAKCELSEQDRRYGAAPCCHEPDHHLGRNACENCWYQGHIHLLVFPAEGSAPPYEIATVNGRQVIVNNTTGCVVQKLNRSCLGIPVEVYAWWPDISGVLQFRLKTNTGRYRITQRQPGR